MIKSFKHKGLKRFYEKNDNSRLNIEHVVKIKKILSILDAVEKPEELYLPTFRFHPLTGNRKDCFAITVHANWRITFKFNHGNVYDVNLEDYH